MDRRVILALALHDAVARGDLEVHYQPQIDLASERIVAAEALCRWTHPTLGVVAPAEFIPIAEEEGLIHLLGQVVLDQSCRAVTGWSEAGLHVDVSVNVSPLQLESDEAFTFLESGLECMPERSGAVTLEVTEVLPILDMPPVVERLEQLHSRGVGISIDDFGTGHSSFSQLRSLPATEVKIDQTLIQDGSDEARAIVATVVEIAHRDGIRVVAEGVESREHLEWARELQCDRAQGYLIGWPMPEAEFRALALAGV